VVTDQKGRRLDELTRAVFGTAPAQRLRNYAERSNAELRGMIGTAYTLTVPVNYLLLISRTTSTRRCAAVDLLLIRGKWTSNQASQYVSDALHTVLQNRIGC